LERPLTLGFRKPEESKANFRELARVRQSLAEAKKTEAVAAAALEKLRITKGRPPPPRELGYFEVHPERAPLSRYGSLALCPPHMRKTSSEPHLHRSRKLPDISSFRNMHISTDLAASILELGNKPNVTTHLPPYLPPGMLNSRTGHAMFSGSPHGHIDVRHPTLSGSPHQHLSATMSSVGQPPVMYGAMVEATTGTNTQLAPLLWHGCTLPCPIIRPEQIEPLLAAAGPPDLAYEHIVEQGTLCPFAEGVTMLPVCHEDKYQCHLVNFEQGFKITEAYEPGFRAQKRETIDPLRYANFSPRCAPRKKVAVQIEEINCDVCGFKILRKKAQKRYFYCYKCKEHGKRYELCPACHDREKHQGDNRHFGPGLHPHFTLCSHKDLTLYKRISSAYPRSLGLLRALCDHCGGVICCQGDHDARLFVCTTCRDHFGLRFELCEPCFLALHRKGWSAF